MRRKLLAPDPASIRRPDGPAFDDSVGPAHVTGTPGPLTEDLTGLVGEGQVVHRVSDLVWVVAAFVLEAIARDTLSDPQTAERAVRHALDLAGPDRDLSRFLCYPPPDLHDGHDRHASADRPPIWPTVDLLAGADRPAAPPATPTRGLEALTHGETRILRYLPTNLSAREIASELCLSVNTVKTHQRHLYTKLGARSRTQAVAQARALGLLARRLTGADSTQNGTMT